MRFASTGLGGGSSEPVPVRVVRSYFVFVFYISNGWRVAESEIDRWPGARAVARARRIIFGIMLGLFWDHFGTILELF